MSAPGSTSVTLLPPRSEGVEIVEHKGTGHPDTICDALAEELSSSLSRWSLERFGRVLHHNVDKALLLGGSSRAWFGGGEVLAPIEIDLAGRATTELEGERIPIEELALDGSRAWLRRHLHALDPDRHVKVRCRVRSGSADLTALFAHGQASGTALANDTSCGAGFAPLSALERTVLACADALGGMARAPATAYVGEDVKVMGVRRGGAARLTVACAFVAPHVPSLDFYADARAELAAALTRVARRTMPGEVEVVVNAADDLAAPRVYLTVTGTSAEAGDDGEVGRGNRVNRLITPCRPMTLEAAAGKNPVSHVGKLYQLAASRIAAAVVGALPELEEAECFLVSEIGRPVDEPAIVDVRVRPRDAERGLPASLVAKVEAIAREETGNVRELWRGILGGQVTVF